MGGPQDVWTAIWVALPSLLRGLLVTIEISALAIAAGTLLGLLCGIVLAFGPAWARLPVRAYVDIVRGIPVLVLIFACFYGLPFAGLRVSAFEAGAIALGAFATAHITEVVRGGIESIPRGQSDAARAIGLRFAQRLRYVILPQAMRRMLPPWVNAAVEMVKGSSLVSLIGVVDLLLAMQQVVGRTFIVVPFYALAALFYFAINFSMSQSAAALERRFGYLKY
jgi:polar amino acid transport system permease protein